MIRYIYLCVVKMYSVLCLICTAVSKLLWKTDQLKHLIYSATIVQKSYDCTLSQDSKLLAALHLVCIVALCSFDQKKKKITTASTPRDTMKWYISIFFFSLGQVKGGMCSCAASDSPTLLLTPERDCLSITSGLLHRLAQGYGATAPPRQCYIVRYTQRIHLKEAEDFNEGTTR